MTTLNVAAVPIFYTNKLILIIMLTLTFILYTHDDNINNKYPVTTAISNCHYGNKNHSRPL